MTNFVTLFLLFVVIFFWMFLEYMRHLASNRLRDPQVSSELIEGTAAIPFINKIGPLIDGNSELLIVSGLGNYPNSTNGAEWIKALKGWLELGAHISYIVTGRTRPNFSLCELGSKFPDQFHFVVNERETGDEQEFVEKYRYHHPCILVNSKDNKKQAMWIEGFHGDYTHIAENVEYIAPTDISNDRRFQQYLSDIRRLKEVLRTLSKTECSDRAEGQQEAA